MSRVRYEITGTLTVLSPLHVGDGHAREIRGVGGRVVSNETLPMVATIARDAMADADGIGRPYLPPTAIKGLLRRLAEGMPGTSSALVDDLFGTIKDVPDERDKDAPQIQRGSKGAIEARGAFVTGNAPSINDAPYRQDDTTKAALGPWVFVAARTAIDPRSGTADDGRLYFQEMVAPGTQFQLRLALETRGPKAAITCAARAADLVKVVHGLCASDGVAIGKGQADGNGRVRLDPMTVDVTIRDIGRNGEFTTRPARAQVWTQPPAAGAIAHGVETIRLVCEGPFLVVDSSFRSPPRVRGAANADRVQVQGQMLAKRPLLLGSSVSGALRARAEWLFALNAYRAGHAANPHLEDRGADAVRTPVEELFGTTGFRGLLEICGMDLTGGTPFTPTSVKIDRFSGGTVFGQLFSTETTVGAVLVLQLRLDPRRSHVISKEAEVLFVSLLESVRRKGLEIGHGSNKGFGWFRHEARS